MDTTPPNDLPNSRNIPLPVQREVRQRCGFGCVVCGLPLYEYEHMLGWAQVQRHVAKEITLLCDKHHREKTNGLLPIEAVQVANQDPLNLKSGTSKPYDLHYSGAECEAFIGGNYFQAQDQGYGTAVVPIGIDGVPLLAFVLADGHLLLNLNVFDKYNNLTMQILNNQLVYSTSPWDIQFVGRNLIIREADRQILVDIRFEVPNRIVINRGRFLLNGVELVVSPSYALIVNNRSLLFGNSAIGCHGGILIGSNFNGGAAVRLSDVPRYYCDGAAAIKWANERMKEYR